MEKQRPQIPMLPFFDLEQCPTIPVLEMAPTPTNPRNSEGAFLPLDQGRLLFAWSRYEGSSDADDAEASIYGIISTDRGASWSAPRCLVHRREHGVDNIMSVSLLRLGNGDVGLFYYIRKSKTDGRLWLRRSRDEGETWSTAQPCIPGMGHYVINNDRVLRLKSGRLLVPAAYHRVLLNQDGTQKYDMRAFSYYFFSDDDGETWQESNPCTLNAPDSRTGLQEPGAIELAPGVMYGWARTDVGCQYQMLSIDGGSTWSEAVPSRFMGAKSPMSMKMNSVGEVFAVWNPIPRFMGRVDPNKFCWGAARSPLVMAKRRLDGSWTSPRWIENMPDAGYCYTAMHFDEDGLLLAYCAGQESLGDSGCLNRLRMVRVPQQSLMEFS